MKIITPSVWTAQKAVQPEIVLPRSCTKYELIKLLTATNKDWLDCLIAKIHADAELSFLWSSVNDLSLDDQKLQEILRKLEISDEMVAALQRGIYSIQNPGS